MTNTRSPDTREKTPGRARRVSFITAVVLSLAVIALLLGGFPPVLTLPVTGWLPDAAFEDFLQIFTDEENLAIHRMHAVGFSLIVWTVLIGVILQLRTPENKQAPLWAAAVMIVASVVVDFTIGLSDPFVIPLVVLILVAVALHPGRLPEERPALLTGPGKGVAILTAVAGVAYAYGEVQAQINGPAEDPHVELAHFAGMATLGIGLAVAALIGASNLTGRRITAWMTGSMVILMGAFFIGFPDFSSSPGTGWGAVTVILGAAYLFLTLRSETSSPRDSVRQTAAGTG